MQLDLNILLEEIYSWKTVLKERDDKIETFQNQITRSCKENKILEDTHKSLLVEIAEFNNALSSLHSSISRLDDYEADKKCLSSEKKKLEDTIKELKKLHQKQQEEMKEEVEQIKLNYKRESETELLKIESTVSARHENYLNIIKEKDNYIVELEDEISKIRNEKEQDILKIKIECEEKINKMKTKFTKTKGSHPLQDDFKKDDIFRQKYIKVEKESREEIAQLKKQVKELQSEITTLKSSNNTPIHPLLQENTAIIHSTTTNERNRNFDKGFTKQNDEYLYRPKRVKFDDNTNVDSTISFTNGNIINMNVKDSSESNQVSLVKPIGKKKLFNIDLNYF